MSARICRQISTGCVITPASVATADKRLMLMCNHPEQEEESLQERWTMTSFVLVRVDINLL